MSELAVVVIPKTPLDPSLGKIPPDLVLTALDVSPLAFSLKLPVSSPEVVSPVQSPTPIPVGQAPLPQSYSKAVGSGSLRNLRKIGSPSLLSDGIPSVDAPDSVLFESSSVWKDHLVAHFHGSPPSPAKIFSDLNPIWGSHGRIAVRHYSPQTCLIYIPSEITRNWVLEVAFWQAGHCAFTVTKWSSSACLAPMKLDYAPIWVNLKNVPAQLYDLEGLSVIGSGLGIPLYTEKAKLQPNRFGLAKIKVVMKLDQKFPSAVRVKDKLGNSVTVLADYPHVPHKCHGCNEFGHLLLRCPRLIEIPSESQRPSCPVTKTLEIPKIGPSTEQVKASVALSSIMKIGQDKSSCSPTSPQEGSSHAPSKQDCSSSSGWTYVAKRSAPPKVSNVSPVMKSAADPLTSAQLVDEEIVIIEAQKVIRNRAPTLITPVSIPKSAKARKRERRKIRQELLKESLPDPELCAEVTSSVSLEEINSAFPIRGRSLNRSDHLIEAQ
ncbi:hypothetical protein AALP_AA4G100400 [Arabis alpina]|uniref:DUF4283 domain-containing protein n=1 Tax=Arabis alpina TaxID=50452 RepID=A0A087H2B7_ARAAL|nr:hypothetical protein AALP_AA4G100400 [Arabis alpina]